MANFIVPGVASPAPVSISEQTPVAGAESQSSWKTALAEAKSAEATRTDPAKAASHFVLYSVLKDAAMREMRRLEEERREAEEDSD